MRLHKLDPSILFHTHSSYRHLRYAHGSLNFDTRSELCQEIINWCKENCTGDFNLWDSSASYTGTGVLDVTVFAFANKQDAVLFKMEWESNDN